MSLQAFALKQGRFDRSVFINIDDMDRSSNVNQYSEFEDVDVKHEFLRKVFAILFVQLGVTLGFVAFFLFYEESKEMLKSNPEIIILAIVLFVSMYFILLCPCCYFIMEAYPMNWIVLSLFTLSMAFLTGVTTSEYELKGVLQALVATVIIVFILTLFALQTACDFTSCGTMICMVTLMIMIFGSVFVAFSSNSEQQEKIQMGYTSLMAIMFCIYIIYDIQLIVGGDHPRAEELSPDNYILGAVFLYIDIVYLFLSILRLIGNDD